MKRNVHDPCEQINNRTPLIHSHIKCMQIIGCKTINESSFSFGEV